MYSVLTCEPRRKAAQNIRRAEARGSGNQEEESVHLEWSTSHEETFELVEHKEQRELERGTREQFKG